ncbi:hypothetical protein FRB91_008789 [Serendipita sp. 411]|nr:hypothetical protein FRC19_000156 [Serendipita sp. 401]KAG8850792.1 hypothetical protein FRB91_008789 [Serendipita sp. 411]KAG9057362.1 hypothetical protein FS842_007275 [Serendipita sp. 407]
MEFLQMQPLIEGVLAQIKPGPLQDPALQGLRHIFPDSTILGALSLINGERVTVYVLSNGRSNYIVEGSTATSYTIQLDLNTSMPYMCSCYSFIHGVLSTRTHIFCKHILAVRLAIQMNRLVERRITEEGFANLIATQMKVS